VWASTRYKTNELLSRLKPRKLLDEYLMAMIKVIQFVVFVKYVGCRNDQLLLFTKMCFRSSKGKMGVGISASLFSSGACEKYLGCLPNEKASDEYQHCFSLLPV